METINYVAAKLQLVSAQDDDEQEHIASMKLHIRVKGGYFYIYSQDVCQVK